MRELQAVLVGAERPGAPSDSPGTAARGPLLQAPVALLGVSPTKMYPQVRRTRTLAALSLLRLGAAPALTEVGG